MSRCNSSNELRWRVGRASQDTPTRSGVADDHLCDPFLNPEGGVNPTLLPSLSDVGWGWRPACRVGLAPPSDPWRQRSHHHEVRHPSSSASPTFKCDAAMESVKSTRSVFIRVQLRWRDDFVPSAMLWGRASRLSFRVPPASLASLRSPTSFKLRVAHSQMRCCDGIREIHSIRVHPRPTAMARWLCALCDGRSLCASCFNPAMGWARHRSIRKETPISSTSGVARTLIDGVCPCQVDVPASDRRGAVAIVAPVRGSPADRA